MLWKCRYNVSEDCNNTDCLICTLDKIKKEIEFEVDHRTNMLCAEDVFDIIDKYKDLRK